MSTLPSAPVVRNVFRACVATAEPAVRLKLDATDLHSAHGYLLPPFLSPISNTRADAYGGDRAGRMRFALGIARAGRAAMLAAWCAVTTPTDPQGHRRSLAALLQRVRIPSR